MTTLNRHRGTFRALVGLLLIAVGLGLFLDRAFDFDIGGFGRWWPLFLVGFGLWKLSEGDDRERRGGMLMVLIGGVFLVKPVLRLFGGYGPFFEDFHVWPLIIVAVGLAIIWGALWPSRRPEGDKNDES